MATRILIVEDNLDIATLIKVNLQSKNMYVEHVSDGQSGFEKAISNNYNLIILDLMLPKMDGMDVCREIRKNNIFTPILMLTAKNSELDRVLGLEVGADDYLTKPFSVPELLARVCALIRRSEQYQSPAEASDDSILNFENLEIQPDTRQVILNNECIELTAKEFDLLIHFANHPGRVYSRAQLLSSVWGYGHEGYEHTVNSHINRLRSKIEDDPAQPKFVMTVWGVGYKFNNELRAQ